MVVEKVEEKCKCGENEEPDSTEKMAAKNLSEKVPSLSVFLQLK